VESQEEYDAYGDNVYVHTDGTKQKDNPGKPEGLIAVANAIKDMRTLSSLSLRSNSLLNKKSGEALAGALKGNLVLTELDISNNYEQYDKSSQDGMGFSQALAVGLIDNLAVSKLIFNGGCTGIFSWEEGEAVALEAGMTEANFSNKKLGAPAAIIISAWLSNGKHKGVLTSLNLASNNLGELTLPTGWTSGIVPGAFRFKGGDYIVPPAGAKPEGVIAIANTIPDMRALSSLNMSENRMRGTEAGKALGNALAVNTALKELDLSGRYGMQNMDFDFIKALAPGLSVNRTLSSLNVANNEIGELVIPEGWHRDYSRGNVHGDGTTGFWYLHTDGREQKGNPGKPEGVLVLVNAIKVMDSLTLLDLTNNRIQADAMGTIIMSLKNHAIEQHRACAYLVPGNVSAADPDMWSEITKDLRALLVATYNFNPRCWLPSIAAECLRKDVARWL
jgi:Leucine-rich repeat (LRR) protein